MSQNFSTQRKDLCEFRVCHYCFFMVQTRFMADLFQLKRPIIVFNLLFYLSQNYANFVYFVADIHSISQVL